MKIIPSINIKHGSTGGWFVVGQPDQKSFKKSSVIFYPLQKYYKALDTINIVQQRVTILCSGVASQRRRTWPSYVFTSCDKHRALLSSSSATSLWLSSEWWSLSSQELYNLIFHVDRISRMSWYHHCHHHSHVLDGVEWDSHCTRLTSTSQDIHQN